MSPPRPPRNGGWRSWSGRRKASTVGAIAVVVLLVVGVLAACRPAPAATASVRPSLPVAVATTSAAPTLPASFALPSTSVVYTIDISRDGGGTAVSVEGTTNLPDGAVVSLVASRASVDRGETDVRAIHAGDADAVVAGGRFSGNIHLDESVQLLLVGKGDGFSQLTELDKAKPRTAVVIATNAADTTLRGTPRRDLTGGAANSTDGGNGTELRQAAPVCLKTPSISSWLSMISSH